MYEHSIEPWRVITTNQGRKHIMSEHNKVIADVRDMKEDVRHDSFREFQKKNGTYVHKREEESTANAHLMGAAPKLLERCEKFKTYLKKHEQAECDKNCTPKNCWIQKELCLIQLAINQAKGQ